MSPPPTKTSPELMVGAETTTDWMAWPVGVVPGAVTLSCVAPVVTVAVATPPTLLITVVEARAVAPSMSVTVPVGSTDACSGVIVIVKVTA